jgi:hypothetical protein
MVAEPGEPRSDRDARDSRLRVGAGAGDGDRAVRSSLIAVTDTLAELGLSFEILRKAMCAGEAARDACTANDPPWAAGFDAWARTVRALREILIPQAWTRDDEGHFSSVISPDGHTAIVVATGDVGTGNRGSTPKTKYPRGPATAAAIDSNRAQLKLFEPNDTIPIRTDANVKTWMLVRRRDGDVLFSELSLPIKINEDDDRVEAWATRIVFQPITISSDPVPEQAERAEQSEEIEVKVVRRRP